MGIISGRKFKPTLFVGLGGHGGKIVDLLASRLRRHPNWERISAMTHFVAIDTNVEDLHRLSAVRPEERFLISAFDRRAYIARKRGLLEQVEDPLVTQWIPSNYQFRASQGLGAGQIRMESRLNLYYNLEDDSRSGIRRKILELLHQSTLRENPWRDNEDRVVRVVIYASVAGGTGSGCVLPMAWLLRDMVLSTGWGRPNIVGILSLPTTFLEKVKPELHADIMANGYAALKEIEHLTRQLGYDGGRDRIEFHYDPGNREARFVDERPFSLTYLIDRPAEMAIDRYEHAVADASFLQIFSPMLGAQAGEYDNYDKHQKKLANGHFSVHWAAFGTALLHLPRRDLLRYASMRHVARAFREYLCFGGDEPQFRVPWGDPAFERLEQSEKDRKVDEKFKSYVAWRAQIEEQANEKGVFSGILSMTGKDRRDLLAAFQERLSAVWGRLDEIIQIPDIERQAINPGNPSIERSIAVLRREHGEARGRVREFLETQQAELRVGRFLGSFFQDFEVNPIAQRYLLIRLLERSMLLPGNEDSPEAWLAEAGAPKVDLDSSHTQAEKARIESELARTATQGFLGRMVDSENKAFQAAKARAIRFYDEQAQGLREDLRRWFWKSFEGELRQVAGTLLSSFRKVSEIADDHARLLEAETERFRADPAADPDSDVARYYLDAEVLRDDRRSERLWNLFYEHHLDRGALFDPRRIFPVVSAAFTPARDHDGRQRARDASEIVRSVRESLEEQARGTYTVALQDIGLDLSLALDLEQRYIALLDAHADWNELRAQGKLNEALAAVPAEKVRAGIEDRLERLAQECVLLAHIDTSKRDDLDVRPADVFYCGLHARFDTDEPGCLARILGEVVPKVQQVQGWEDPDALVLYRGLLGVPVYWFRNVQSVLQPAYRRVRDDPKRTYPLHIESEWESSPGIPDLDPVDIRRAQERQKREDLDRIAREARQQRVRAFVLAQRSGGLVQESQGWSWTLAGARGTLGVDRIEAFSAFEALDPTLRRDLESQAEAGWRAANTDPTARSHLVEELQAHSLRIQQAYALAVAERREPERRLLEEERQVLASLLDSLSGAGQASGA